MRARLAAAGTAAHAYLAHVLDEPCAPGVGCGANGTGLSRGASTPDGVTVSVGAALPGEADDRAARWTLRREAYRALAEARAAIALSAAELPALARHTEGTDEVAAILERARRHHHRLRRAPRRHRTARAAATPSGSPHSSTNSHATRGTSASASPMPRTWPTYRRGRA